MSKNCISNSEKRTLKGKFSNIIRKGIQNNNLQKAIIDFINVDLKEYSTDILEEIIETLTDSSYYKSHYNDNPETRRLLNADYLKRSFLDISSGVIDHDTLDTSTEKITNVEQIRLLKDATEKFLDDAYGMAREARLYAISVANENLFNSMFANRGSIFINSTKRSVDTNEEMNENIRQYQEYLFKQILDYIGSLSKDKVTNWSTFNPNLKLYKDGKYTGALEQISNITDIYLSKGKFKDDTLRLLYEQKNTSENSRRALNAYNAYVLLKNFDSYLAVLLDKSIIIENFGDLTGGNKYSIADKLSGNIVTFRKDENIDVEKETNPISRLAINTTRRYKNGQLTDEYIQFSQFSKIIGKIKSYVTDINCQNYIFDDNFKQSYPQFADVWNIIGNKSLSKVINSIRMNPKEYLHAIFQILSNDSIRTNIQGFLSNFNTKEIEIIESLNRGIFNDLRNISEEIYSYVCQTADSIFDVRFIQYYKDGNLVSVRSLLDMTLYNIRRKKETAINVSGYGQKVSNNIVERFGVDKKLNRIEIPINDNYQLWVDRNGDYTIYDISNPKSYKEVSADKAMQDEDVRNFVYNTLRLNYSENLKNALINKIGIETQSKLIEFAGRVKYNQFISQKYLDKSLMSEIQNNAKQYLNDDNVPSIDSNIRRLSLISPKDVTMLKDIAEAIADVNELTSSVYINDGSGNKQNTQSTSRLLGSIFSQLDLIERKSDSATRNLPLVKQRGLLSNIFTAKEFFDGNKTKQLKDMTPNEMTYVSLVCDYLEATDNKIRFLPSVNSDKNTIGRIEINCNLPSSIILNGKQLRYIDLDSNQYKQLIAKDLGNYYLNIYNTVKYDFNRLSIFSGQTLDYDNGFESFNASARAQGLVPIELLRKIIYEYNQSNQDKVELMDQVHFKENKGDLGINLTLLSQLYRYIPEQRTRLKQLYPNAGFLTNEEFFKNKNKEILMEMLKNGFQLNTSNIKQEANVILRELEGGKWVDRSGNIILAYVQEGNKMVGINKLSQLDKEPTNFILNPVIEKYNLMHYYFTQQFMNSTVGSFISHPDKSKSNNAIEQEASQFQAQHKRNVSFTAAMEQFSLGLDRGIPTRYNIAVIEDVHDKQGTVTGDISDIKPFDGATFENPFISYLENKSLGGQKVGGIKKPFVHFKVGRLGCAGIIKTAAFPLDNNWVRNSPMLQTMMKKMTDRAWGYKISDITKYLNNENIEFKRGNNVYNITNITQIDQVFNFDLYKNGEKVESPLITELLGLSYDNGVLIDSNYKLWKLLGGEYSTTNGDYSEISVKRTVDIINSQKAEGVQFMKNSDVHWIVTAGAIKQGASNINPSTAYTDDNPLLTQSILMYQSGIQLDKEHHADDEDLSLLTQVISACAANGYTFEVANKLYNALYSSTKHNCKDFFEGILEGDNLQETIYKTIIDNLGHTKSINSFAAAIASDILERAKNNDGFKFSKQVYPLSDNTIYAKILSSLNSYLTNTGIRQRIPGVLSILCPSFGIYKLFNNRKYESYENPEKELQEAQQNVVPVYNQAFAYHEGDTSFMGLNIIYVEPNSLISNKDGNPVAARNTHDGNIYIDESLMRQKFAEQAWTKQRNSKPLNYNFKTYREWVNFVLLHESMHSIFKQGDETSFEYETRINEEALKRLPNNITNLEIGRWYNVEYNNGTIEEQFINDTIAYKNLKELVKSGVVKSVTENIIKGRDLAAKNYRFKSVTGESYQLHDLDSLYNLVQFVKLYNDYKKTGFKEALVGFLIDNNYDAESFFVYPELSYKQVRKNLQNKVTQDTLTLSKSYITKKEQLLQTINKHPNDFKWLQYSLQILLNERVTLDQQSYKEIVSYLQGEDVELTTPLAQKLKFADMVKINGNYVQIDKNSVQDYPYEIIMPKVFATKFGLKEFDDLQTISNDKEFFIKRYLENVNPKNQPNAVNYKYWLKRSNGKHIYVLDREMLPNTQNLTKLSNVYTVNLDGKVYREDYRSNIMYEITKDTEIYKDDIGNEFIVTDDPKFYLDSLSYDSVYISNENIKTKDDVINCLLELKESSNNVASDYYWYVSKDLRKLYDPDNEGLDFKKEVGDESVKLLLDRNTKFHDITLNNYQEHKDSYIYQYGIKKHNCFMKALNVIAARIPAQSMQSFMNMRIAAFDNPDINTAYVSTLQLLLQGSDYDIDSGSLAVFDINSNGLLDIHTPYARLGSMQEIEESFKFPFPTGQELKIVKYDNIQSCANLLNWLFDSNVFTLRYLNRKSKFIVDIDTSSIDKLVHLGNIISNVKALYIPNDFQGFRNLMKIDILQRATNDDFMNIYNQIKKIIDKHNLYFDKIPRSKISRILNNMEQQSLLTVSSDTANLTQSQTPIDGATSPLKKIGNTADSIIGLNTRTPGNWYNMQQSINENSVGKDGIAIQATGLKNFFAETQYCNAILNDPNADQTKVLIGVRNKQGKKQGVLIAGKTYRTLANIRPINISTINNITVLEALANNVEQDDAAITHSAMLSLATDNAKELQLSKLNAGNKTMRMYIFATSIGMSFDQISSIMMSKQGRLFTKLLEEDVFNQFQAVNYKYDHVFKYFEEGPYRQLQVYSVTRDPNGNSITNPLNILTNKIYSSASNIRLKDEKGEQMSIDKVIQNFASPNTSGSLQWKLDIIENLRNVQLASGYTKEVYNQLIDFIQTYLIQSDTMFNDANKTFYNLKVIAKGAEEIKKRGQILGVNQGIKTQSDKYFKQIRNIENIIIDAGGKLKVGLFKFAFDEDYRNTCVKELDKYTISLNTLDIISSVPHYLGYIQLLAISHQGAKESFKYRSVNKLFDEAKKISGSNTDDKIIRGFQDYIGDYMRDTFLLSQNLQFRNQNGELFTIGTKEGNIKFREFMENYVFPRLQEGKAREGVVSMSILNNKFIKDLGNDAFNKVVSGNTTIINTLPINMLPKADYERVIFNKYKSQFNALRPYNFQWSYEYADEYGIEQTATQKYSIIDLVTFYAMIAFNWKLNESSIVSLFEDLQNFGQIQLFHDFIDKLDKSKFTLQEFKDDMIPYVIPHESVYRSYAEYTWDMDDDKINIIYRKKSNRGPREDKSDDSGEFAEYSKNRNGYSPWQSNQNLDPKTNYQMMNDTEYSQTYTGSVDGVEFSIIFNRFKNTIDEINIEISDSNKKQKIIDTIKQYGVINKDGSRVPNIKLIESLIKDAQNEC